MSPFKPARFFRNQHIRISIFAIFVGLLSGFGAVAVRAGIKYAQHFSYGGWNTILGVVDRNPLWWRLFIPSAGGLLVGLLTYYFAREAKGHGVPEVMTGILLSEGRIRKRVALVKALASSICIGTGGSVGREGPLVQIGAGIGSTIGQWFREDTKAIRTLVACGAAGGIAAAFNAPFAGCLFAVEIILGDFGVAAFSPIVISSVTATLVSHHFEGDFPVFVIPIQYRLQSPLEMIPYTVLGFAAGYVALLFIKVLYSFEDVLEEWRFPEYLKPMLGGLVIGVFGLFVPHILGVGYETINMALKDQIGSLGLIAVLLLAKILATSLTLGSGGSGGIFAPSLYLGALVGSAIGILTHRIYPPALVAHSGAYAVVGMGAVVAGATHAPITAIITIFELTKDYQIFLPLMLSCIISSLVTSSIKPGSIYTQKLLRRGILFKEAREDLILKSIPLRSYVQRNFISVHEDSTIQEIMDKAMTSDQQVIPVVNSEERLTGVITFHVMKTVFYEKDDLMGLVVARDIMEKPASITIDKTLWDCMRVLSTSALEELPVLENGRLVGIIDEQALMEVYNKELGKRNLAISLLQKKKYNVESGTGYELGGGMWLREYVVNGTLGGKTLEELNLRYEYDIEVVLVYKRSRGRNIIPTGKTKLEPGDKLVVIGRTGNLARFSREIFGTLKNEVEITEMESEG
ncbi:MAG: CBS domain-containing protein [Candidatus Hydrogenedentota bacterium]|nr:MAG: CBS domain-containing protein [Candidatus Hydrogenedentota bacterium]